MKWYPILKTSMFILLVYIYLISSGYYFLTGIEFFRNSPEFFKSADIIESEIHNTHWGLLLKYLLIYKRILNL